MAWDTVGYEVRCFPEHIHLTSPRIYKSYVFQSTFNGIASSIEAIASIAHEVGCQQVLHEYSQRQLRTVVVLQPSFDISSTFWILLIFFFCPASFSDEIWDSLIHRVLRYDTSASILPSSLRPWEVLLIWLAQTGHPQALQGLLCPSIAALVGLLQNPNSSLPLPSCIVCL